MNHSIIIYAIALPEPLKGLVQILGAIVKLIGAFCNVIGHLADIGNASLWNGAAALITTGMSWVANFLFMAPMTLLTGSAVTENFDGNYVALQTQIFGGAFGIVSLFTDAGLCLTILCFLYGLCESSIQFNPMDLNRLFGRCLRWIVVFGIVSQAYTVLGYIYAMFFSLYSSNFHFLTADWFADRLTATASAPFSTIPAEAASKASALLFTTDGNISTDLGSSDVRTGLLSTFILLIGLISLTKKVFEFIIELFPAVARVVLLFIAAPIGMSLFATTETSQKGTQYIRTFGSAVLLNLFKMLMIAFVTVIVCSWHPIEGYSILDVQNCIISLFTANGTMDADFAGQLAFIMTGGGLLGMQLYIKLLTSTCHLTDRVASEIHG